jgi:phosphatidylglycerol:prolipoprotein diacylglycerol transferase
MIGLWSARFFIEFFKEAQVDGREDWILNSLNTGQVLSIPLILVGLWLVFRNNN